MMVATCLYGTVYIDNNASAQQLLLDDDPFADKIPVPDDYEFEVISGSHAVIGVRPNLLSNFDIDVYTDTTYSMIVESSALSGDVVDLVALDESAWASPPNRGARVTTGTTNYVVEMENDLSQHTYPETWTGWMNISAGGYGPVLEPGPWGAFDMRGVRAPSTILWGGEYSMWYTGSDELQEGRMGLANSSDGIIWTKDAANPVLGPGLFPAWDSDIGGPDVLYDGTTYRMWFSGSFIGDGKIGLATSSDGIGWTKHPSNPVLDNGVGWESQSVGSPSVIYDGSKYHMWYTGGDATIHKIGYANSSDGVSWTKYPSNPVLDLGLPGAWDDTSVFSPSVMYRGGEYHMWFTARDDDPSVANYAIGYATSPDGLTWTKHASNPVLTTSSPWAFDDKWVFDPNVLHDGTQYRMWYSGRCSDAFCYDRIGHATSPDGVIWTKLGIKHEVLDAYEITGLTIGADYTINLDVPATADLDLFLFDFLTDDAQSRAETPWSSTNSGMDINESIFFTATISGDYILVVTNNYGGAGQYNLTFNDSAPTIIAYEPGGFPALMFTQGTVVQVTWNATDDNPLPPNPINITYGSPGSWNTISNDEANDGYYLWDTSTVPCPGTYSMNLSVYDSSGQTTYDEGNYTFDITCLTDDPPLIEAWEPGGSPTQTYTQGDLVQVTWNASDDYPLPFSPINITYGSPGSWSPVSNDEPNDGAYIWDTSAVPCPGTYWMNASVYDSAGQTAFDESNFTFDITCPIDDPPVMEAWEPGGTSAQTYTQGDSVVVTWNASDDNPLPPNPINITFGNPSSWNTISADEANDGSFTWDTSGVLCPGAYWMNISVYDSAGQTTYDEGNFSFEIACPIDLPPLIESWEPGGTTSQSFTQGEFVLVTWNASDDNALPVDPVNITYGSPGSWTPVSNDEQNDGAYLWDTSGVPCPGTYSMNISVYDSAGQTSLDEGNYTFEITCPIDNPPTIEAWEPGGTASQSYLQGDLVTVTWIAYDDNSLPPIPVNITYGTVGSWNIIASHESNDGLHVWDTGGVQCPGTYWMNLSVHDSSGQTSFDESNYTFDITCPIDDPPALEAWEPGGFPSQSFVKGDVIQITWVATDDNALPSNPINITYGSSGSWNPVSNDELNDGAHLWDTDGVQCPGTYWINVSVYDDAGQGAYDHGNFSFEITCPIDNLPTIQALEPGGTPSQSFIQGDLVAVEWTASDDNILPAGPINISYGSSGGWTQLANAESNDGTYTWDTTDVQCPGTYWINVSVVDSSGQSASDIGNHSFGVTCPQIPPTEPPIIVSVEVEPDPQTAGGNVKITALVTDNDSALKDLTVTVEIRTPDGAVLGNFTMIHDQANASFHYSSSFDAEGSYSYEVWAMDPDGNVDSALGFFEMQEEGRPPPPEEQEYNWKPIVALAFTLVLLFSGLISCSLLRFKPSTVPRRTGFRRFLVLAFPFIIAEASTGVLSYLTGYLSIPPLVGWGMGVDLGILLAGLAVSVLVYRKYGKMQNPDQDMETLLKGLQRFY
jgi:predicted GH43/DUF377 family glycosyl hydrolase